MTPAPDILLLSAILVPFLGALIIPLFHRRPNLREAVTIITALALGASVLGLLAPTLAGLRPRVQIIEVLPGLALAFEVEPLGMLFALVASLLWVVNSIYSIGYMRSNEEPRQTGYYVCFAIALGSTMGVAFAKNLFTLFLFYEVLTISTYPLVTHHRDARVFGIDLSESMIQAGRHRIATQSRVHLTVADSEHLPFADNTFDYVTCSNSFHHYPNQLSALKEMFRVLRSGGTLFLTDGYRDNPWGWLIYDVFVTRFEGGNVHHMSAREFREAFAAAGFADIQQRIVRFPAPFVLTRGRALKE